MEADIVHEPDEVGTVTSESDIDFLGCWRARIWGDGAEGRGGVQRVIAAEAELCRSNVGSGLGSRSGIRRLVIDRGNSIWRNAICKSAAT